MFSYQQNQVHCRAGIIWPFACSVKLTRVVVAFLEVRFFVRNHSKPIRPNIYIYDNCIPYSNRMVISAQKLLQ